MNINKNLLLGVTILVFLLIAYFNFRKGSFGYALIFLLLAVFIGWSVIGFRK